MRSRPLRVGIIGVGGMGARHARNLHRRITGAKVAAVFDTDRTRAARIAAECGPARVMKEAEQLIDDEGVEAVLIASPDETHAELVMACLHSQKPVLCEKPLATTAEAARAIVEAEVGLNRKFVAVGFMRRFDPQHLAVKEAVSSGSIGRPLLFKGVHRNASVPADFPAAAAISQAAIHDIDSARWLLEQEIEEVQSLGQRVDDSLGDDVRDLILLQFRLSEGCLGAVELFLSARYGYEVSAEVVGQRGSALTVQPFGADLRIEGKRARPVPTDWLGRFQDAYVGELEGWVASMQKGSFSGADAWDGYLSLAVSDACIKSLRSGRPERVCFLERPSLYEGKTSH